MISRQGDKDDDGTERERAAGRLTESHGHARDESQRDDEALREREELTWVLTENASDFIRLHTVEGRSIYASPSVERLYGRAPTTLFEFAHPEDLEACQVWWEQVVAGEVGRLQWRVRDGGGNWHWLETSASRLQFKGQPHVLTICRDITENKRAEEQNRQLIHDLDERVKELTALHRTARLLQDEGKGVPELLQEIVPLLPPAWQYPEVTGARIRFGETEFKTPNYAPTRWSQEARFTVGDSEGVVEVVYLEERPEEDSGPFLSEERDLIDSLAEMIRSALERRLAQEALRASEERFFKAFYTCPVALILTRLDDGRLFEVNEAAQRLLGFSREELRGRTMVELGLWADADDRRRFVEGFDRPGPVREREFRFRRKQGDEVVVLFSSELMEIDGVQCVQTVLQDITKRKRAEEELRLSEERFAKAFHASPEAITIHRHRDGVFLEANERWLSIYGYTREEVIGRSTKEMRLSSPEVRDKLRQTLEEQGSLRNYEIALTTKQGEIRQVSLSAELFVIHGETCSIYLQLDITERKRAEEKLRRYNEELRALSARLHSVREEESARIAREIHDELGASLSSLKWGLEEIGEDVAESVDTPPLAALREKVAGLITLTDNAVDAVRRIASELRPTALEEFGLAEAFRWHAEQFQARTGIAVHCDCVVEGAELNQERATALFRIVQEALTNVLRHAQATKVEIRMNREADNFVLTVSDNGKGITKTEKSAPQSLGLLGMRERAHLLGGEINIESAEGRGTVVTVRVPINR